MFYFVQRQILIQSHTHEAQISTRLQTQNSALHPEANKFSIKRHVNHCLKHHIRHTCLTKFD